MEKLLQEIVDSYYEYVQEIIKYSEVISNYLKDNKINEALELISNFSEGITWITSIVEKIDQLGYEQQFDKTILIKFLEEINDGLEKQDYNLVADIFKYEVIEFFEEKNNLKLFKN